MQHPTIPHSWSKPQLVFIAGFRTRGLSARSRDLIPNTGRRPLDHGGCDNAQKDSVLKNLLLAAIGDSIIQGQNVSKGIGNSIIQGQKTEFKRGLDEHKILCRPKIRLPEAVHLVEDLRCKKEDIVIVLCGTRELKHKTRDEISLQFEALIHTLKNKSKNAIITSILPQRHDVNLNS
ncbi:SGNH hydrolase-type esterase domain [Trinorchestia longiramus]|nr:SGNH hydrolase-type esterase domain [Trinorchestia longiramus]